VAVGLGLTVDVPGEGPDVGVDVLQPAGLAPVFFEERAGEGGKGFDGAKEVGSGGGPGRAVLGEATARNDVVDRRVVLEVPAPGRQDTGKPREISPEEALIFGPPLAGRCRRLKQGLGSKALLRAEKGTQGLRDREGEEKRRPRELLIQVVLEPLWSFLLLALGTMPVATGTIDAVFFPTALALREAVAVMAALARLDGTDGLTVCSGEGGIALQGLRGTSREDIAESRHGSSPCLSALRRSSASSCPLWVRGRESMVVASWGWPRERWLRRGCTPASSRWVAYECRRVGMATPLVVIPARRFAVRKAPWTLERLIGEAAVGPGV
jgi:hypothetical protein